MSKLSNTVLAGLLSVTLFAAPAFAQKEGGGINAGSGKAAGGGGGGGGKAISGGGGGMKSGGGGGGNRSAGGGGGGNFKAHSNTNRSPGTVRSTPRSSGVVIQQNRGVHRDRNVGGNRHVGRHRGTRYLWGGLPFYFYDGYYHGDCGWLRRRAEATGSRYWWIRYRQCREDD
jgi:hypothetical protein